MPHFSCVSPAALVLGDGAGCSPAEASALTSGAARPRGAFRQNLHKLLKDKRRKHSHEPHLGVQEAAGKHLYKVKYCTRERKRCRPYDATGAAWTNRTGQVSVYI